jgi:hypothetical protein
VTSAYSRPGTNIGKAKVEATYFAGPEGESGFPEFGQHEVISDSYAWKAIMAVQAQVGFLMDKSPEDVTVDDIRNNGLLIGVKASDLSGADVRVVVETPPEEGDEPIFVSQPVSFPGGITIEVGEGEQPLAGVGPEMGDYFTTDKVQPSMYLYGDSLVRWMADFFQRHEGSEDMDYELGADVADRMARKYLDDLLSHHAILEDFPGEPEDIEEESLARRVNAAVERALAEPMPARRIFIPQWLVERGGPGSGHFGHEGIPGHRGGSMPGDGGAQDTRVGITGQHSEEKLGARIVPDWQLKKEMEALRAELVDAGVRGVRVEMGRGGYQGGWEQSWVLSYKGVSDAAKRILAETAAKYGQDSFVVFEPPTEGNSHAASNLSLDVDGMDPTVVANIEARLTEHKFGGWTWSEVDGKPRLQLNVVPEFGGDDQKHPAMVAALETDLKELGIRYQRDDWRAAVTAVGPGVKVEYQAYLESLRGRALTGYRQGYIVEDQKGVGDGNVEGVGGSGPQGIRGQEVTRGTGEVRCVAEVAAQGVAKPGAVGRQPGDFHSQVGPRTGVVISRVLRRFVLRGGEGSGHYGHAGIPGHRGGSLPGEATSEGEQAVHEPRMFKNGMEPLAAYQTGVLAVALDDAMMKAYAEAVGGREQERREVLADMFGVGSSPTYMPSLGGTARAAYKEAIVADLVANVPIMKKDEGDVLYQVTPQQASAFANDLVHQWAISANDTDMRSLSLQQMVSEQFDVPLSEWQEGRVAEMARLKTFDKGYGPEVQSHKTFAEWAGEQHGLPPDVGEQAARGMLQRMYDRTQEQFLAAGISEVTLYRGISRDAMLDAFPEPRVLTDPAVPVRLTESNAVESWSFSPTVAEKFAHSGEGLVIAATIPVRQILSTFSTGFGCSNEAEVIVLGSLTPINAYVGSMLENFVEGGLENPR